MLLPKSATLLAPRREAHGSSPGTGIAEVAAGSPPPSGAGTGFAWRHYSVEDKAVLAFSLLWGACWDLGPAAACVQFGLCTAIGLGWAVVSPRRWFTALTATASFAALSALPLWWAEPGGASAWRLFTRSCAASSAVLLFSLTTAPGEWLAAAQRRRALAPLAELAALMVRVATLLRATAGSLATAAYCRAPRGRRARFLFGLRVAARLVPRALQRGACLERGLLLKAPSGPLLFWAPARPHRLAPRAAASAAFLAPLVWMLLR